MSIPLPNVINKRFIFSPEKLKCFGRFYGTFTLLAAGKNSWLLKSP